MRSALPRSGRVVLPQAETEREQDVSPRPRGVFDLLSVMVEN